MLVRAEIRRGRDASRAGLVALSLCLACGEVAGPGVRVTVEILSPDGSRFYAESDTVRFAGRAVDSTSLLIEGVAFNWASDVEGHLGQGPELATTLVPGFHTVTLEARVRDRSAGTATVRFPVERARPGRMFRDRPDERSGNQVHVVYATTLETPDLARDVNGSAASIVKQMQGWLRDNTGHAFRIDTYEGGQPDITYLRLIPPLDGDISTTVENEISRYSLRESGRLFLVLVEGSGSVGGQAGLTNAVVFLENGGLTWKTSAHELLHLLGVLHTTVRGDIMNVGPTGGLEWDPGGIYTSVFLSSLWVE